jgi:hypothetical protein
MFNIVVVVVIHRHDVTYWFGNPSHGRIHLYKNDAVTHFDALLPVPPVLGNSLIIPESQNSQLVHQAAPDSSTGSNPVVLKDWCFVPLGKHLHPGKHLGFRAIGTLVYHPRCVDDSEYGFDWFSTEIQGIKSDCVVVSANAALYRLEGPAAPARHNAQACLAEIMESFCQSTWPPNAQSLFQQLSKFFLSSHEAKQGPVSSTSSSSLEAGWFTCVCSYMVVYGGVWKCVYVVYGGVWLWFRHECLNPRRSVPIGEAGRPDETEEVVSRRFPKRPRGTVFLQKEATPETSSGVVRKGRPDVPEKVVSMRFTKRPRGTDVLQKEATPETSSGVGGDDLFLDKQISQDLNRAPKDELFRLLRVKGHTPFQRSIRPGNILVECSTCHGSCRSSHYRRDAWHVTVISEALESRCIHAQPSSDSHAKPVKRLPIGRPPTNNPTGMVVVYGGVWW